MTRPLDFPGKTALISGAASGIGRALALQLAERGCALALIDIRADELAATVAQLPQGHRVSTHVLDVASREAVAALPAAVLTQHAAVDLLFNNAGVAVGGAFTETTEADFDWLFEINFHSLVRVTRVFLPHLLERPEAHIVNTASLFLEIHQDNPFKAKSYASAAFAIERLPIELADMNRNDIAQVKGIGASSAQKIIELLDRGSLQSLEELIQKTPSGILEMMQIKGLGPKKVATIWKEMHIETIGELLYACNENRLLRYKGFGEKTQKNVAESIEFFLRHKGHFLWAELETYAERIRHILVEAFPSYTIESCGLFKRQMPVVDALEWSTNIPFALLHTFFEKNEFQLSQVDELELTAKGIENVQLRFYRSSTEQPAVVAFRKNCSELFLNEWIGQFQEKWSSATTEEEVFIACGISPIPTYLREDPAVIERYKDAAPIQVIQPKDIRGIIHSHSDWSDGANTIEEMAVACRNLGMEYLVISDHSKSAFYANGLQEERVKAQHQYIDELNSKLSPFHIFKSIECDILNDGALDYSDALLSTFDLVIASVHSNLNMDQEKAMQRLTRAIEHPATTILGHPTGRLLLSRKGYPIDHERIIDACIKNGVAIEINAHPRRLDLDWAWVGKAQEKGAILSINPDAHVIDGFNDVRYGVLAAQKGGLLSKNNLSSYSLTEFTHYLKTHRKL